MAEWISPEITQAAGLCGVFVYLLSYALLQTGVIGGNSYTYAAMNAGAAGLVLISLIHAFNMASLLIQVSFILISLFGMARVYLLTRKARFSAEEQEFISRKLPDMPRHLARRFLNAGSWVDMAPGEELTREGQVVARLSYVAEGSVEVWIGASAIGVQSAPTFIGEISCMEGTPATASVKTRERCRCFVIAADRLRNLAKSDATLRLSLMASMAENTRATLRLRSAELAGSETSPLHPTG